ncbi:MAG: Ldh family oxidoreductase [Ruminococcaceae bacterium]|nr:Ldh family oxidoreductase [Oscillospiraceae bacterium]
MEYRRLDYECVKEFCHKVYEDYGFTPEQSRKITDVLLAADLSGIESHGVQRMVRYHKEITEGLVKVDAAIRTVKETPICATLDANDAMGQLVGIRAMELAMEKARKTGIGMVAVRDSNHFGIAGYYTQMAAREGFVGICMTNTEAIMVPTFGRQAMLGTNPIAFSMPADPVPFTFDAATTVVPRGKLEVYAKRDGVIPEGWALDETGNPSTDASRVLGNIIGKTGGGILPLGGAGEDSSGYKGYGFAMLCEIFTSVFSDGTTSNYIYKTKGRANICHFFMALDHGIFGDKETLEKKLSVFLQELRDSQKAEGCQRIYTHGEKEFYAAKRIAREGIPVNPKTYEEMRQIGEFTGALPYLPL